MTNLPANPNSLQPTRQPVDIDDLHQMVDDLLGQWTKEQREFTAYGVTMELRALNPGLEIPHDGGVRERVHYSMTGYAATYNVETRTQANGMDAATYFPLASLTIDTTADVVSVKPLSDTLPSAIQVKQLGTGIFMVFDDEA